jgi:predicted nucleic acid-binding protein
MSDEQSSIYISDVYLDTSVIVAAIVAGSTNHTSSAEFCARLTTGGGRIFFSNIVRLELSQAIRKLATKAERLDPGIHEYFGLGRWETDFIVRQRWMQYGIHEFERLMGSFAEVIEIPFRSVIWRNSVDVMIYSFLQSHDAIHVATARHYGLRLFVTTDDHFARIDDLDVILIRDV